MSYTLADLTICASAMAWKDDGEILASGIGVIPRLGASLAMLELNGDLMMTDGEAYLVSEPVPLGPRDKNSAPNIEGWMGYSRVFDCLWGGYRHAMITPVQIDCFGQTNISFIGDDYHKPKVQLLGARGLPGNSNNHANSFFVPDHNKRAFVTGEVDMVAGAGYNPERFVKGARTDFVDLRLIVTNLCVMDFSGPKHKISLRSLHPGITAAQVLDNTGFDVHRPDTIPTTAAPSQKDLACIARLDPHELRMRVFKDNTVFE